MDNSEPVHHPPVISFRPTHREVSVTKRYLRLPRRMGTYGTSMREQTWLNSKEASKHLGLGITCLRELQWNGELTPGKHWIYANGKAGGPVRYNINAIREWQSAKTVEAFDSTDRIEIYQ